MVGGCRRRPGRCDGLDEVPRELALARDELLDEVEGVVDELLRRGEPVELRDGRYGRRIGLRGLRPRRDRADDRLLALADGREELVLALLRQLGEIGRCDMCALLLAYQTGLFEPDG